MLTGYLDQLNNKKLFLCSSIYHQIFKNHQLDANC